MTSARSPCQVILPFRVDRDIVGRGGQCQPGGAGARFVGYRSGGHLGVGHQQDVTDEIARLLK